MTDPRTQVHHLVTRAYQKNFADAQMRVSVLDAHVGAVIDPSRPIRGNFTSPGYNTAISDDGGVDGTLEQEFCNVERRFADQLPRMRAEVPCTVQQHTAVCELFALHLVRSPGFRDMVERTAAESRQRVVDEIVDNPEYHARYLAETGRYADRSTLHALASLVFTEGITSNRYHVDAMARHYNNIVMRFAGFRLQIIDTTALGVGFPLADVPVVHADPPLAATASATIWPSATPPSSPPRSPATWPPHSPPCRPTCCSSPPSGATTRSAHCSSAPRSAKSPAIPTTRSR